MLGGYYLGQLYLGISGLPSAGILSVVPSSHQLSSDNITLTQKHSILVDSTAHALGSENITLTQKHVLTVENAIHTLMSENVAITSEQVLGINDAFHGLTSTEIALTQKHTIVVSDTTHSLSSNNLDLVEHKTLVVQNTTHTHTADGNLAIIVHFYLVVADASHGHTAQSILLTQKHALAVANTLHGLTSTNIAGLLSIEPFGFGGGFGAVDGFGIAEFGAINIEIPNNWLILGLDSYHTLSDNFTAITQKHTIVPQNNTIDIMSTTLDLIQQIFRYSGIYIRDSSETGELGDEYEKATGTIERDNSYFGNLAPVVNPDVGFLIAKVGSSGSYNENDTNSGIITVDGRQAGELTEAVPSTGIYTRNENNNGEYEEI